MIATVVLRKCRIDAVPGVYYFVTEKYNLSHLLAVYLLYSLFSIQFTFSIKSIALMLHFLIFPLIVQRMPLNDVALEPLSPINVY